MALMLKAMILPPNAFETIWNDQGSNARYNVQAWSPRPWVGGFYVLGDLVESSGSDTIYGSQPRGPVVVVSDVSTDGDRALAPITAATLQWTNAGPAGNHAEVGIWGLNPPPGFAAIGTAVGSPTVAPTDPSQNRSYMAVNTQLLLPGQIGAEIWDTHGYILNGENASFWQVTATPANPQGIAVGQFVATTGYDAPSQQVFTLNPAYVTWVPFSS